MDLLASHISLNSEPSKLTDSEIEEQVKCLTDLATTPPAAKSTLNAAYALIRSAPSDHRPQLLAATLLEKTRTREHMCDTWAALFDRFPHLNAALRYWIRWLNREGRAKEAVAVLQSLFDDESQTDEDLAAQAELYAEIRDPDTSDHLFAQLISRFPDNIRLRVIYGKALFARGEILRAFDILDPIRDQRLSPTAVSVMERNDRAILAMETIRPHSAASSPTGPDALFNAVSLFNSRTCRDVDPNRINGISFYTGSLGAGGAERQLTLLARTFHNRARTGRNVSGTAITGNVEVVVNSVDAARGKDFFKSDLKENAVDLSVCQDMPQSQISNLPERLEILEDLLPILPANSRFGLERLAAHLQEKRPDVVYIWQDGAVLTGALAALVANVPRIAISLRGFPPNLRPHLMKPEYRKLNQALIDIPGVTFSCNSRRAAEEYCRWLDLPTDRFSVLYNAVTNLADQPSEAEAERWKLFETQTSEAQFTLGGVFRFTPNKRGLLWVDYAAEAQKQFGRCRFILVGDGAELEAARAKAALHGIEDRILFVGKSSAPGFWYEKMDAALLLSEHEGLPNVLIEAQMKGIPVISTPAGGAQETFTPEKTGFLLSSATSPDRGEFLQAFEALLTNPARRASMGRAATGLAQDRFSLDHVLTQTVQHFHGKQIQAAVAPFNKVTPIPIPTSPPVAAPQVRQAYNIFANN